MATIQKELSTAIVDKVSKGELDIIFANTAESDPEKYLDQHQGREPYLDAMIVFLQRSNLLKKFVMNIKETRPDLQPVLDSLDLDIDTVSGQLYTDSQLEIDRKSFQKIRSYFEFLVEPNFALSDLVMQKFSVKNVAFERVEETLKWSWKIYANVEHYQSIKSFLDFCMRPESEIFDTELEKARLSLLSITEHFNNYVAIWVLLRQRLRSKKHLQKYLREQEHIASIRRKMGFPDLPHIDFEERSFFKHTAAFWERHPEEGSGRLFESLLDERFIPIKIDGIVWNDLLSLFEEFRNSYYAFVKEGRRQLGVA